MCCIGKICLDIKRIGRESDLEIGNSKKVQQVLWAMFEWKMGNSKRKEAKREIAEQEKWADEQM